jgi:hypothetical protein
LRPGSAQLISRADQLAILELVLDKNRHAPAGEVCHRAILPAEQPGGRAAGRPMP